MRALAAAVLLLSACSLIVEPEVPAPDGGEAGGSAGGSAGGQAGGTAGGAAGGSAGGTAGGAAGGAAGGGAGGVAGGSGGGSAGGSGGGAPMMCPGSTRPRADCTTLTLQTGGAPTELWMATAGDGLVAAWAETLQHKLEARRVFPDGGIAPLLSLAAGSGPFDLSTGAEGEHWAIVWRDETNGPTRCTSSVDAGLVVTLDAGTVRPGRESVSVSESGAVATIAAAGLSSEMFYGQSALGCPTEYAKRYMSGVYLFGPSVVHVPDAGLAGFRFTSTGRNTSNNFGELALYDYDRTGYRVNFGLERMSDHVSAISDDGAYVQAVTYNADTQRLNLRSLRADLSTAIPVTPVGIAATNPSWVNASCGPDCFALVWSEDNGDGTLRIKLHATSAASPVAKQNSPFDVACSVEAGGSLGVARLGQKIAVGVSAPGSVTLYLCAAP